MRRIIAGLAAFAVGLGLLVGVATPASAVEPIEFDFSMSQYCGKNFTFGATVTDGQPHDITVVRQGDESGNAQVDTITLQPGYNEPTLGFVPAGDYSYFVEVRDESATVLFQWYLNTYCTNVSAAISCVNNTTPVLSQYYDAQFDTVSHQYVTKLNGTTISSVTTMPGEFWSNQVPVTLASGAAYTLTQTLDGEIISNTFSGPSSGTAPTCKAPVIKVTITGSATVGGTLKCNVAATAYNEPFYASRQWLVAGLPIEGATQVTFKLTKYQYNKLVSCAVRGVDGAENVTRVTSKAYKVGLAAAPVAKTKPSITGTAKVGYTVKVKSNGVWSPKPTSFKYQWYRKVGTKLVAIKYATKSYYKLTRSDRYYRVVARVFAVLPYHKTGSAYTPYTAVVK